MAKSKVDVESQIFGTKQAQEYLGLDSHRMRYYVNVVKRLRPDFKIGYTNIFKKESLDAFKEAYLNEALTLREAADYLGVKYNTLRYHLLETKLLQPDAKRGNAYIFKRDTLDVLRPYLVKESAKATQ